MLRLKGTASDRPSSEKPPPYESTVRIHTARTPAFSSGEWEKMNAEVTFYFAPGRHRPAPSNRTNLDWEAQLSVKTKDAPRMMREGFHWTAANFQRDATHVEIDPSAIAPELRLNLGWTVTRTYYLTDLADDPNWTAMLLVAARDESVVRRFRVADLSLDKICWAFVWDPRNSNQRLYKYVRDDPSQNYNSIYEDMLLEGWWPWPRAGPRCVGI
ncbi:hypothetical protein LZ30DRAFT_590503 [Colletotrichum cereale]|nr:hypothetical protein LZ30DRAFT_590503 [Colletotrichum cereale]